MLDEQNEKRLRHLVGAWSLRARPDIPSQQASLLRENIEAVEDALAASAAAGVLADNIIQAEEALSVLENEIQSSLRSRKPLSRRHLRGFLARIEEARSALRDRSGDQE